MHLFKRARAPDELVTKTCAAYEDVSNPAKAEKLSSYLREMKIWLYGEPDQPAKEDTIPALLNEVCKSNLITYLCTKLVQIEFEARKDVAQIFNAIMRRSVNGRDLGALYLESHKQLLDSLLHGYDTLEVALITGSMLREAMRREALAGYMLQSKFFNELLAYTDVDTFEIASDAFLSFKELLTKHQDMANSFMLNNRASFFSSFNTKLLTSSNYVTRRQSLKLLGELLLSSGNLDLMMAYINELPHLMLIMQLLRDESRSIAFEAFHIFKVFVANPNKPPAVLEILTKNQDRLLRFLSDFQNDREDDEFAKEKEVLSNVLKQLTA